MAVEDRSRRRQNSQKIAGGRKDYQELLKMSGNSIDGTWGTEGPTAMNSVRRLYIEDKRDFLKLI
jgi:hypothetical protein